MKTSRIYIALICAALTAACGCDDSSSDKTPLPCDGACLAGQTCNDLTNTCEGTPVEIECKRNSDCTGGLVCENSHCVATCKNNDDCGGTLVCRNDKCVPECENNDDCEGDLVCRNKQCKPECENKDDCSGFLVCRENHCKPECESASDCNTAIGEFCYEGQCRTKCVEDSNCASGHCDNEACVDCLYDAHCADNPNGSVCAENNCVECNRDADCNGTNVCVGHVCQPACQSDAQCAAKDSHLPYCNADADNHNLNAVCVACMESSQCDGSKICVENTCRFECTSDLDCSDGNKCDLADNHCYACVSDADCGSGQKCNAHVCNACEEGDSDCDGVIDEADGCPFNPNVSDPVSAAPEYDCNYVTDDDGKRVFEIWHASDFKRLRSELANAGQPPVPEPCVPPADGEDPTIGQCCDWHSYPRSCSGGKALMCTTDGIVTQEICEYGCTEDNQCASCRPHVDGTRYTAGDCCESNDFESVCVDGKVLECQGWMIAETKCLAGCDGAACKACNENPNASAPAEGDCCDPMMFVPMCQDDGQTKFECIDGVVVSQECADCTAFGKEQVVCKPTLSIRMEVRMMRDINLADAAENPTLEIVDRPFEDLNVPWRSFAEDENGEKVEKIYVPGESGYQPFEIPDATCVMRWEPVSLQKVHFDGRNHRIFFKNASGESCSLVDPLFEEVDASVVESLSLNYNMRGLAPSMFARKVRTTTLTDIHFAGNINLEDKPVLNEVSEESYIDASNKIINNQYYGFGVLYSRYSGNWSNYCKGIHFKGNITQNTNHDFGISKPSGENVPLADYLGANGFQGLFGVINDSTYITDSSVVVPDYVLTHNRSFNGWAFSISNSRIVSPVIDIAWIGANNTNNSTVLLSAFANEAKGNSSISDGIFSRIGAVRSVRSKDISFVDFIYKMDNLNTSGDFQIESGNITDINNYYGLSKSWSNSNHADDIIVKHGPIVTSGQYIGLGEYFNRLTIDGDLSITLAGDADNVSLKGKSYLGVAYNPKNSDIKGKVTIHAQNFDLSENYYGIASDADTFALKDVEIMVRDLKYGKYYGLYNNPNDSSNSGTTSIITGKHTSADTYVGIAYAVKPLSLGNLSIKTRDITAPKFYYGLGQELSSEGISLNGQTRIEVGNLTDMGPIYGLASTIKNSVNDIKIRLGNVTQKDKSVSEDTHYFWGLADTISGSGSDVISNVTLDIGNITSPFFVKGLFQNCRSGITTDNINLTIGDIMLDTGKQGTRNHGDFDGLCRDLSTTLSNISAKFGHIYIIGGYKGWVLGSFMHANGKYENVKVEAKSLIMDSGRGGAVDDMEANSAIDGASILIRHLQTDASEVSAIKRTMANTSVRNFSYYADVYAKNIISSGFINNITDASLSLENIFSAARLNTYSAVDQTTHKANSELKTVHNRPHLFNAMPQSAVATVNSQSKTYRLDLAQTKNVYWLMRDDSDYASESMFVSQDGNAQFPGIAPEDVASVLQSEGSENDAANTLSGCENAASCDTVWAPAENMKAITESSGKTIHLPWLK